MRLLRKLFALAIYSVLFLPTADYRTTAWLRALEVTQTSLDRTLRRRRSRIENDRLARHLQVLTFDQGQEERTLHGRRSSRPPTNYS